MRSAKKIQKYFQRPKKVSELKTLNLQFWNLFLGYYADAETECQAFHVCTADGAGGLAKYSFLCPNGTIFNQGYFICDWWFNFDCAEAEGLYSLNDDVAAEREAASAAQAAASDTVESYAAPGEEPLSDYAADRQGRRQGRQGRRRFNN